MKKIILALFFTSFYVNGYSKIWEIKNSGNSFSPTTLTIQQGDSVNFKIESAHNAAEISQSVWNANGNSPVIGFSAPFGGGIILPVKLTLGTHYYVCTPHASLGMKGKIIVQPSSGIDETKNENEILVYPNPVINPVNIQYEFPVSTMFEIKLFDIRGNLIEVLLPKTLVSGAFFQTYNLAKETLAGVYILKMTFGRISTFKKLVIL